MEAHRKHAVTVSAWLALIALVAGCAGHHYKPSPETVGELSDPIRALMAVQESLNKIERHVLNPCNITATGSGAQETCPDGKKDLRYQDTPIPEVNIWGEFGTDHRFAGIRLKPDTWVRWPESTTGIAAAERFATGWYVLAQPRKQQGSATHAAFLDAVKHYRSEPQTYAEALRRVQVQVEGALKEHRVGEAAMLYRTALKTAAGWPEGHFNLALFYGELEFFADAINEMKRYLYLVPNASDARAAQDKIYDWELKAK